MKHNFIRLRKLMKGYSEPMVVVTIVLAIATFLLYAEASRQRTEIKEEFEIETKVYLQVTVFKDELSVGSRPLIKYQIENLSKEGAQITEAYVSSYVSNPGGDSFYKVNYSNDTLNMKKYCIKEAPDREVYSPHFILSKTDLTNIESGKSFLYFKGEVKYENLVTHKHKTYFFRLRIYHNDGFGVEMLNNKNE
jgi:hypothetical protein